MSKGAVYKQGDIVAELERRLDAGIYTSGFPVGADLAAEAFHRRGIKGDAGGKGAFQLAGHDGHIMLFSVDVAEGQTNESDVLLLNELYHFFRRVLHVLTCFS